MRRKRVGWRHGLLSVFALPLAFALLCTQTRSATAQIATDGTMGQVEVLSGLDVNILAKYGKTKGGNLFHSFSDFNIANGGSATFTGPDTISNVISRVTGGRISNIDGLLKSEIKTSNFFFINPAGVMFGPNASIDVPGSFHVSTADQIRFPDNGVFDATPPANPILSSAPPEAFGFLNEKPADIEIQGSFLNELKGGTKFALIGGDITLTGGQVSAPGGQLQIELISVASVGQVDIADPYPGLGSFDALGKVALTGSASLQSGLPLGNGINKSKRGGSVRIEAGQIVVDASEVLAQEGAGLIELKASDSVDIKNRAAISTTDVRCECGDSQIDILTSDLNIENKSVIESFSDGGVAGNITLDVEGNIDLVDSDISVLGTFIPGKISIRADTITLSKAQLLATAVLNADKGGDIAISAEKSIILTEDSLVASRTSVLPQAGQPAVGGSITLSTGTLEVSGGSLIDSTALVGSGGPITISVDELVVQDSLIASFAQVDVSTDDKGGRIEVTARNVLLESGGQLLASAFGLVDSGDIVINATGDVIITGTSAGDRSFPFSDTVKMFVNDSIEPNSGVFANSLAPGNLPPGVLAGDGGDITISAGRLEINNQGKIAANTLGSGDAGNVVAVADALEIKNGGEITSRTSGAGSGGTVRVNGRLVSLSQGGRITTTSESAGAGGNIVIDATGDVIITGRNGASPSGLFANSLGLSSDAGRGGTIEITSPRITIADGGLIASNTLGPGDAGQVKITAPGSEIVLNGGTVSTISSGPGDGGSIFIAADDTLTLTNNALITASSTGAGAAGNITIRTGESIFSTDSTIATATTQSDGGDITIETVVMFQLDDAAITTSAAGGDGSGGNITIDPQVVILFGNSRIQANAFGGAGGNILISSGIFFASQESLIEASSALGIAGNVTVDAPDSEVQAGLVPATGALVDASTQIAQQCAARGGHTLGSFVGTGRGGLPARPGMAMEAYYTVNARPAQQQTQVSLGPLAREVAWSKADAIAAAADPKFVNVFIPGTLRLGCSV